MSKEKMKFPPVPGDTPRKKFINLGRHLFQAPKSEALSQERKRKRSKQAEIDRPR